MTTPSKWARLNEAADLYIQFGSIAMAMCEAIKGLHGKVTVQGDDSPEKQELEKVAKSISGVVEMEFHKVLDPYVKRLEEIDQAIKANLPKPPGSIILPGDNN